MFGGALRFYFFYYIRKYFTKNQSTEKYMQLTTRECQILSLLSKGNTDNSIAIILAIEIETVKSHNKNVFRKLNVRNRAEAVLYWLNRKSDDCS